LKNKNNNANGCINGLRIGNSTLYFSVQILLRIKKRGRIFRLPLKTKTEQNCLSFLEETNFFENLCADMESLNNTRKMLFVLPVTQIGT
jgi:hypothetical protein